MKTCLDVPRLKKRQGAVYIRGVKTIAKRDETKKIYRFKCETSE